MITTAQEYIKYAHLLQHETPPIRGIQLPTDETIYEIDLNSRTINAPEFLSVATDHYAETVYFKVDRYFDNMDLTTTVCIIQYVNENATLDDGTTPAGGYIYPVPFYDVSYIDPTNKDKILIPWCISGPATAAAGPITFSVKFFLLNEEGTEYIYNLNTIPAESKILHGMDVIREYTENFYLTPTQFEILNSAIANVANTIGATIYWSDADLVEEQ